MADPVAIVSIVSGAAVAIGVPFINARLERSRLEQQSRDARLGELRDLLDGAAQHLYRVWTIFYEIEQEVDRELPRPEWSDNRLRGSGTDVTEQTDVVVEDGIRIALRTEPGAAIVRAHGEAQRHVVTYELEYRRFLESERFHREKPPPPPSELLPAMSNFMKEVRRFAGVVEGANG
jgi:hypothetical protein